MFDLLRLIGKKPAQFSYKPANYGQL